MNFSQIDLIRILEGVELSLAVDAILSTTVYQDGILAPQEELVTQIENILFDQLPDLSSSLTTQFKVLYGQNVRSLIAYITNNPLAAGSDYPTENVSLFTQFIEFIISLLTPSETDDETSDSENVDELIQKIEELEQDIDELEATNSELSDTITTQSEEIRQLKEDVRDEKQRVSTVKALVKVDRDYYCGLAESGGTDIQIVICNHMRSVYNSIADI